MPTVLTLQKCFPKGPGQPLISDVPVDEEHKDDDQHRYCDACQECVIHVQPPLTPSLPCHYSPEGRSRQYKQP